MATGDTAWLKDAAVWDDGNTLCYSIPFTWTLPKVRAEINQRHLFTTRIRVGGPAVALMPHYFDDLEWVETGPDSEGALQRMNPLATRTTIGCVRRCSFCAVPVTEGAFRELKDWPDLPIICDNNLLAASQKHFDRVCDRLEKHKWCDFNQGLDARLLNDHHAERLARLRGAIIRLALDHARMTGQWQEARDRLLGHGVPKSRIRTYVLIAFNSGIDDAWQRCEYVQQRGVLALPQWYHPLDAMEYNAVLPCHEKFGWNAKERDRIMQWYYQHRGKKPQESC